MLFAYVTSDGEKYFGDQPDRSMYTFGLCTSIASCSSCQGHAGCAITMFSDGKSAATSSMYGIGRAKPNFTPLPPGRPAPTPVVPEWNSTISPSSCAFAHNG